MTRVTFRRKIGKEAAIKGGGRSLIGTDDRVNGNWGKRKTKWAKKRDPKELP